jgi:hypothetical protein
LLKMISSHKKWEWKPKCSRDLLHSKESSFFMTGWRVDGICINEDNIVWNTYTHRHQSEKPDLWRKICSLTCIEVTYREKYSWQRDLMPRSAMFWCLFSSFLRVTLRYLTWSCQFLLSFVTKGNLTSPFWTVLIFLS